MPDITRILNAAEQGDSEAAEQLLPLVYSELRKLAASRMAKERPGQTLDATGLVHEAYLRLVQPKGHCPEAGGSLAEATNKWHGRSHFFAAAAEAMRRILIEKARQKKQLKRGGRFRRVEFHEDALASTMPADQLLALDDAMTRFESIAPEKAELVKLRFFVGMKVAEAAEVLGISVATAERHWAFSRAWLYTEISDSDTGQVL